MNWRILSILAAYPLLQIPRFCVFFWEGGDPLLHTTLKQRLFGVGMSPARSLESLATWRKASETFGFTPHPKGPMDGFWGAKTTRFEIPNGAVVQGPASFANEAAGHFLETFVQTYVEQNHETM